MRIMKEKDKLIITEKFKQFLQKNKLLFGYNSGGYSTSYIFTKNNENREQSTYGIKRFFEESFDRIYNSDYLFMFVGSLVKDKETQAIALSFLKEKEPSNKAYSYAEFTKKTLSLLEPYKDLYVEYINRRKFLEQHYSNIDVYFQKITDQESKEKIINTCLTTKTFTSLDTQTKIYNFIQKHIRNKKAYKEFFPNIKQLDEGKDIFLQSKKKEVINYSFDVADLNSLNLNKEYGINGIVYRIEQLAILINDMIKNKEINTDMSSAKCNKSGFNNVELQIYGDTLEHKRIDYFVNDLLKNVLSKDDEKVTENLIKESLVVANKLMLAHQLDKTMNETVKNPQRNKI